LKRKSNNRCKVFTGPGLKINGSKWGYLLVSGDFSGSSTGKCNEMDSKGGKWAISGAGKIKYIHSFY
jgi:hypothetical protein